MDRMSCGGEGGLGDEVLLARQGILQREAERVAEDLDAERQLGIAGRVVRVGSAALGLMVWRDLDLTVVCDYLDKVVVLDVGKTLAFHPRVREVVFRDDTGAWNTDPGYPDGFYLGLRYRSTDGQDWKLDIWFVDDPERQPDLQHVRTIPPRLDVEKRLAILRIKSAWQRRPEYGHTVRSFDIYRAVLDHQVRDLAGFASWLAGRP